MNILDIKIPTTHSYVIFQPIEPSTVDRLAPRVSEKGAKTQCQYSRQSQYSPLSYVVLYYGDLAKSADRLLPDRLNIAHAAGAYK